VGWSDSWLLQLVFCCGLVPIPRIRSLSGKKYFDPVTKPRIRSLVGKKNLDSIPVPTNSVSGWQKNLDLIPVPTNSVSGWQKNLDLIPVPTNSVSVHDVHNVHILAYASLQPIEKGDRQKNSPMKN